MVSFAFGERLILSSVSGEFCGYVISQFVNLTIYLYIINSTRGSFLLVFLNYIFALIVYYWFYTIIHLDMVMYDDYWFSYFLTLGLQAFICLPLTSVERQLKRGHERLPLFYNIIIETKLSTILCIICIVIDVKIVSVS